MTNRTRLLIHTLVVAAAMLATPISAQAESIRVSTTLFAPQLEGKLNVNTATAEQWQLLPGVGPATAAKIVAYRTKYPFKKPLHVMRVKGIGRKTFKAIRQYLTVQGETTLHAVGSAKGKSGTDKPD